MRFRWLWLILLSLVLIVPTFAQSDSTPPAALDAATQAIQEAAGITDSPTNWSFSLLPETGNTNLGCLSVSGTETGLTFTPYRMEISFPSGTYVALTLADGSRTVVCDSQLASAQSTPDPDNPLANECTANPVATLPLYTLPSTDMPLLGNLQSGTDYLIVGQSNPAGWFQVTFDNSVGWVEATSVVASENCSDVLVSGFIAPQYTGSDCFVTPAGAFSNARNAPTTENSQVLFQAFENTVFQATSITSTQDWYFIQYGFIASQVAVAEGDCDGIDTVGASLSILPFPGTSATTDDGTETPNDGVVDTNVQSALTQFTCPAGYAGYMQPRIGLGTGNAAIEQGGIPNTLRAFPTVDDNVGTRLGTVQPGRTIDRVLNGPVCNQGFVWWYIEIDGTQGWTAESNAADSSYFIISVGAQNIPPATGGQSTANTAPTGIPTMGQAPVQIGTNPIIGIATLPTRAAYFATLEQGFGEAQATTIADFDLVMAIGGNTVATMPIAVISLDYAQNLNALVAVAEDGAVVTYNLDNNTQTPLLTATSARVTPAFAVSSRGRMAWGNCTDSTCNTATVALYDLNTRAEVWIKVATAPVNAISISPSERIVASGNSDGIIQFWDSSNGAVLSTYEETNQAAFLGDVTYTDLVFKSNDDNQLLLAGCNARDLQGTCTQGRIGLINVNDGSLIGIVPQFEAEVTHIAYYNDGSRFVSTDGQNIIVANASTGSTLVEWNFTFEQDIEITTMVITEDDTRLLIGTSDGTVMMLSLTEIQG